MKKKTQVLLVVAKLVTKFVFETKCEGRVLVVVGGPFGPRGAADGDFGLIWVPIQGVEPSEGANT